MDDVFMIALIYATFGLIAGGVLVPLWKTRGPSAVAETA